MSHKELIDKIVAIEWPMFFGVNNEGGKASCQMDPQTFKIMRESQYETWSNELLQSYLEDLEKAREAGRNVMTEKYARMMERTAPEEYARIKARLPEIDPLVQKLVDEIVAIHLRWKEELDKKYPNLSERGRALRKEDDNRFGQPSLETYMRAELQSLSPKSAEIYHRDTMQRVAENRSEAEENLLNQVRQYGFTSLEEANEHIGKGSA